MGGGRLYGWIDEWKMSDKQASTQIEAVTGRHRIRAANWSTKMTELWWGGKTVTWLAGQVERRTNLSWANWQMLGVPSVNYPPESSQISFIADDKRKT